MTVGQLARLSGLTPKALRHYHDIGVLSPVSVDPDNRYRRYGREQVQIACQIRALRELDVPLGEIRGIVHSTDRERALARLRAHRDRLGARLATMQTSYYFLAKMIEEKEPLEMMPARPATVSLEPDRQRALAAQLFNYVWTLMETEQRTARQTEMMIAAAYASRFFWEDIGEPYRLARGEWQISRACAIAGHAAAALQHAQACMALCEQHHLGPFDIGYAHEAFARAYQANGEHQAAARSGRSAREIAPQIADPDERDLLHSDLDALGL